MPRTIAIGDIHGDLVALETLLARLPELTAADTLLFLGDYVDRGPDSKGVVDRVRALAAGGTPARVVTLRGNHEDKWITCHVEPELGFLLPPQNGAGAMFRSYIGGPPLPPGESLTAEEMPRFIDVKSWLPQDVVDWFATQPSWYEDEHAIYVHAGLEGEGKVWAHPRDSSQMALLWMREPDFYEGYSGKRLVFGHTATKDLPLEGPGLLGRALDAMMPRNIWIKGNLVGVDTGAGKGGFLTAVELPSLRAYESR